MESNILKNLFYHFKIFKQDDLEDIDLELENDDETPQVTYF